MEFLFDLPYTSAVLPVLEHVTNLSEAPAVVGGNIKDPPPPPKFSFEIDTSEAPMVSGDIIKPPPPPKFSFEIDTSEAPMVSGDIVKNPPPPPPK